MVRSSVVSAVSSACEIRLLPCMRFFWSTNSKRSSSRKEPGSLATPCVDQLVLSTQKAEPQDPCAAPAARSARPPEHAIANCLFIPFLLKLQSRAVPFGTRARATSARPQPYAREPLESGEKRRGARRRARVERCLELRLGEKLPGRPGGGRRAEARGRGARNRWAALGIEGAQGAMRRPGAFAERAFARVLLAGRATDLGGQRGGARSGVREQRPGRVERDAREREPGGDAGAIRGHGCFFSTDARAFLAVNLSRFWYSPLRHEGKTRRPAPAHRAGAIRLRLEFSESGLRGVPALGPRARGDRLRRRGKRARSPRGARRAHRP